MASRESGRFGLGSRLAMAWLVPAMMIGSGSVPKQDTSWKRYHSAEGKFCVDYPTKWLKSEVFDGSGVFFATGAKKRSRPYGEIDVSAFTNDSSGLIPAAFSLGDDFEAHISGLKRFVRAKDVQVLERQETELSGTAALWVKDRYNDPFDHSTWFEEMIFARRSDVLYRIELECRNDQSGRFDPVFKRVLSTFQFDCQ